MYYQSKVYKLPMLSPGDTTLLETALQSGEIKANEIIAIMNMTEGLNNGRSLSSLAYSVTLSRWLEMSIHEVPRRIPLIMIGGCTGLVSPYTAVFVRSPSMKKPFGEKRFTIGVSLTRDLLPEEQGTLIHVEAVQEAVKDAMVKAGITDPTDVHCVQVKAPWLSGKDIDKMLQDGKDILTTDIDTAGAYSRGASALGVALALDELPKAKVMQNVINKELDLYSKVASTSAGGERTNCAVIVMGNSLSSVSDSIIGHSIMKDGADLSGVINALHSAGISFKGLPNLEDQQRIEHVFVKSAVDGMMYCRGRRNVLKTDFLAPYSWLIAKAVIHATVTSIVGDPMMQVSGGCEHQGPLGGGLVAIIAKVI